jgi:hypothetical protein
MEEQFYQQNILLKNIKHENSELAGAYSRKEEESNKWREVALELEKKGARNVSINKENAKNKRILRENKKEINRLKQELSLLKFDNKEYASFQTKINTLLKKQNELQDKVE